MKSLPHIIVSILLLIVYNNHSVSQNYISNTHYDTTAFTDVNANLTGVTRSTVNWGDYDNDGDLDILLMGLNTAGCTTMVYRNNNGSFTDIEEHFTGIQSMEASAWGDYDNDGDLDIVITGENEIGGGGIIVSKIYDNDNGAFIDIHAPIMQLAGGALAWGDYDNDGDLDLLITGSSDHGYTFHTKIYRNDDGNFSDIYANLAGVWGSSVAWGDYDNDGDLDIALSGYGTEGVTSKIYRNNDGIFSVIGAGLTRVNLGGLAWGDYDNDGDLDLLFTGWIEGGGGPLTTIYRNNNGSFVDINPGLTGVHHSSVSWGDYDSDGDLDILLTGKTSSDGDPISKVYRNDGGGIFTDIVANLAGVSLSSVKWGDYDNDGDLDILLSGESAPDTFVTKIYRNNSGSNIFTSNTLPSSPTNLTAALDQNAILLHWDKSTDDQTSQDGLSYNIRIGTAPGEIDVVSPAAGVIEGFRRIVQIGNTNLNNSWILKNLPGGKYYWSVQSIDGAYAGSQFTLESTFDVNVYPFTPTTSQIWMDVNDDQGGLSYSMMFGNHINATFGYDNLTQDIEKEAPPCPPALCAVWKPPREGVSWGVGMMRYDFRGIPTNEAKVDTFLLFAKNIDLPPFYVPT